MLLMSVLLFTSIYTYGQERRDLGAGTFTLTYFLYQNGVFSNDSTKNVLLKRIYYIKHYKTVIKTVGPPEHNKEKASENAYKNKEVEVRSNMTAKALYPTYLTDYLNKEYFMFFEETKKWFYYKDSLKNHPEDLYKISISDISKPTIINIKGRKIIIAGKSCSTALSIRGTDTTKFYYTEEKLKFLSPLNIIKGFDKDILGIQTRQKDGNAFGLFLTQISDQEEPNDKFVVPSTAKLKTFTEIMDLNKSSH